VGCPGADAQWWPVTGHELHRGDQYAHGASVVTSGIDRPILVTGAAGRVGGVGGAVVELLRQRDVPVRALVRRDDDRADALRATGAEVVVGDLTRAGEVARALAGCRRLYFGLSVSAPYLETTVTAAAVARS
jgi:NAD(P)H dehydrogenase (quinone)